MYYDNAKTVETSPQGIIVSGVTTSNRVYVTGVSTLTSVGSNLIPDADGTRNIGAATSEWGDLFIDGTANIDTLAADTAAIADLTSGRVVLAGTSGELTDGTLLTYAGIGFGVTGNIRATGVSTFVGVVTTGGDLYVGGDLYLSLIHISEPTRPY